MRHETQTTNAALFTFLHWRGRGRLHWRRLVLIALVVLDEFFGGRFWRICDLRTRLESRWPNYIA